MLKVVGLLMVCGALLDDAGSCMLTMPFVFDLFAISTCRFVEMLTVFVEMLTVFVEMLYVFVEMLSVFVEMLTVFG